MTLTFHPDFATPCKDAIHHAILQSSDDICFHYDLDILATKSDFFAGLQTLPSGNNTPSSEGAAENLIPITKASGPALAFVLLALTWNPKAKIAKSSLPSAQPKPMVTATAQATQTKKTTLLLPTAPPTPPLTASDPLPPPSSPDLPGPLLAGPVAASPTTSKPGPISRKDEREAPPEIGRSSPEDSGTTLIEEIIDTANCYPFNCVYDVLYASLVHYRWPPSIIFAVAVLLDRGNAQYWSQKLLADGEQGLHPWAVRRLREDAPKVYDALRELFLRWNSAFALFKKSSSTTFLADNNRVFGARCQRKGGAGVAKETFKSLDQKGPCPVYRAYQGDFDKFHGAILKKIYAFAVETPGLVGCNGSLERFCAVHVSCQNCVRRVEASARASWLRTMTHDDWSLARKHGAMGPWQDGKKRKGKHT